MHLSSSSATVSSPAAYAQLGLFYSVRSHLLWPEIAACFMELDADYDTQLFLKECNRKYTGVTWRNFLIICVRPCVQLFLSHTDTIGWLRTGLMHLVSRKQFENILKFSYGTLFSSSLSSSSSSSSRTASASLHNKVLLDIGAGDGRITELIAPLFKVRR